MPNVMTVSVSHIRHALQESYSAQEAANLSRIVCCEMLGQTAVDYYLGKDMILSPKEMQDLDTILARLRIPIARENFKRAGKEEQITLLEGDAAEILPTLTEPFDLIFMDAAKGQYIHFMPDILRLLKTGGTLVSDNVLQDGDIIESHYAVIRRNRTIYKRMREYLYELTHRKDLVTAVLPVGDGITVSTKVEVENDEKE